MATVTNPRKPGSTSKKHNADLLLDKGADGSATLNLRYVDNGSDREVHITLDSEELNGILDLFLGDKPRGRGLPHMRDMYEWVTQPRDQSTLVDSFYRKPLARWYGQTRIST